MPDYVILEGYTPDFDKQVKNWCDSPATKRAGISASIKEQAGAEITLVVAEGMPVLRTLLETAECSLPFYLAYLPPAGKTGMEKIIPGTGFVPENQARLTLATASRPMGLEPRAVRAMRERRRATIKPKR